MSILDISICNMVGSWFGAGFVLTKGSSIIKPTIVLVLVLLALNISRM